MLYGLSLLGAPFLLQWLFQGHDQMRWVALTSIVRQTSFAGFVFLVMRKGSPLYYIGLIECASVTAAALFCILVTRNSFHFAWPTYEAALTRAGVECGRKTGRSRNQPGDRSAPRDTLMEQRSR